MSPLHEIWRSQTKRKDRERLLSQPGLYLMASPSLGMRSRRCKRSRLRRRPHNTRRRRRHGSGPYVVKLRLRRRNWSRPSLRLIPRCGSIHWPWRMRLLPCPRMRSLIRLVPAGTINSCMRRTLKVETLVRMHVPEPPPHMAVEVVMSDAPVIHHSYVVDCNDVVHCPGVYPANRRIANRQNRQPQVAYGRHPPPREHPSHIPTIRIVVIIIRAGTFRNRSRNRHRSGISRGLCGNKFPGGRSRNIHLPSLSFDSRSFRLDPRALLIILTGTLIFGGIPVV